jgi:hypothetical protein
MRQALLVGLVMALAAPAAAADLEPHTAQAYAKYAEDARRNFTARTRTTAATRCDGVASARAGGGDGILEVPDGLVHHWVGSAFVRGATLPQVAAVARDYPSYSRIYKSVVAASVLSQQGDTYRVQIRIKEGAGPVTAVLNVRSTVEYQSRGNTMTAISSSDEIREVENAGLRNESLLPAGHDSGYLWRAHTFTSFAAERDGVAIVMETLGLSRRFPWGLGHVIEPFARRLGRKSVETSLQEFVTAIRKAAGLAEPKSACA